MQDFLVLKNQVIDRQITEPPVAKDQHENDEDDVDESVIDTLPENQQFSAKKIVRVSRLHGSDLLSWTEDGDISIHGEPLQIVNFTDLLSVVVRPRPSKNTPRPMKSF